MKKIKYLHISFKTELKNYELPAFRGAVIAQAGEENTLFHNHVDEGFRYQYPLIQYKVRHGQAGIVCLQDGTEEIYHFFQSRNTLLHIGERAVQAEIDTLTLKEFPLQIWDTQFPYYINRWLALDQNSYKLYHALESETEQLDFLARILRGNILSMAKGLDWFIEQEVKVDIQRIERVNLVKYKGIKFQAFDVRFDSNVSLPEAIGLGKGAALGFGNVAVLRKG